MDGQQDKKDVEKRKVPGDPVANALNEIAETEQGVVFLSWLARRCFFFQSTIVGNPQTHDINVHGTLFNESERRLYLDIRRKIRPDLLKRVEQ